MQIDDLAESIVKELEKFNEEETEVFKEIVDEVADETVTFLKDNSPKRLRGGKRAKKYKPGSYAKSWKADTRFDGKVGKRVIVRSTQPQLTHLLEYGHASRNGGRTKAYQHIAPAEEKAEKLMNEKLERRL